MRRLDCRTRNRALLAMSAAIAAACAGSPGPFVKEGGDVSSEGGAPGILWQEDDGRVPDAGDVGGDGDTAGRVGTACAVNGDCVTDFCMTTENIGGFIQGAEVPGGYCSALFCAVDGSDGACTADMGGTCFSLFPFLGESFGEQGICLSPCEGDADCRTADDDRCFDAQELVDLGLVDRATVDLYYANGTRGCLPRTVAEAAIRKLTPP